MDIKSMESDDSEQLSSIFDSRSPQSSATSGAPPRAEQWDRTIRHTGLKQFGEALEIAARTIYPNERQSRYSRVYVLLICWQTQDPKLPVENEIKELGKVLELVYHFDVEYYKIPDSDSHGEVSEKINEFVRINKGSSSDLKIVYYAGHSRLLGTNELAWSTLPGNKGAKCPTVVWSGIQRSLEMAKSDALIILDCCSSGVANASQGNGVTELISACSFNSVANGVGHYSFTHALTTELRLLSKKPCFSVGELYAAIYIRMQSYLPQGLENERYPAPVHLVLTRDEPFGRGIRLSVQKLEEPRKCQEMRGTKRVRFHESEFPSSPSEKSTPPSLGSKKIRVGDVDSSRMQEIVLPWIQDSGTLRDEDIQPGLESPPNDGGSDTPVEPSGRSPSCHRKPILRDSLYPLDAPRALFMIRFREDIKGEDLSVDLFKEWLRSIPAATEEFVVEGGFRSFSTILLLSFPLAMASYLPHDPAVVFLGPIKSCLMLPTQRASTSCGDRDKKHSCTCPHEINEGDKEGELVGFSASGSCGRPTIFTTELFSNVAVQASSHGPDPSKDQTSLSMNQIETQAITGSSGAQVIETMPSSQEGEPSTIYVRNIIDKFPLADRDLAQRLGEANWQRHIRIRDSNVSGEIINEDGAGSVFQPASRFHDSGLGSTIDAPSKYAASMSSFLTRAGDGDKGFFRVPREPKEIAEGASFECPICRRTIPAHFIRGRGDWKMHVFSDIRPYICTFSCCKAADRLETFATRAEWWNHELRNHLNGIFNIHSESKQTTPAGVFFQNRSSEEGLFSSSKNTGLQCMLCGENLSGTEKQYASHVAKHMESIALASLPMDTEEVSDDDEGSAPLSTYSISSHSTVNMQTDTNQFFETAKISKESNTFEVSNTPTDLANMLFYPDEMDDYNSMYPDSLSSAQQNSFKSLQSGIAPSRINNSPSNQSHSRIRRTPMPPFQQFKASLSQFITEIANSDGLRLDGPPNMDSDNTAQDHELYQNVTVSADGLYHCPWEGKEGCDHKPEKLKCNYDKFVESHLRPYRCKVEACENFRFSSTACLLRHEREAHAMHGHGDKPLLCSYKGCDRGKPGNGFPRQWNLRDHLKRVHNDPGPERDERLPPKPAIKKRSASHIGT